MQVPLDKHRECRLKMRPFLNLWRRAHMVFAGNSDKNKHESYRRCLIGGPQFSRMFPDTLWERKLEFLDPLQRAHGSQCHGLQRAPTWSFRGKKHSLTTLPPGSGHISKEPHGSCPLPSAASCIGMGSWGSGFSVHPGDPFPSWVHSYCLG